MARSVMPRQRGQAGDQSIKRVTLAVVPPRTGPKPFRQSRGRAFGWKKTTSICVTEPLVTVMPFVPSEGEPFVAVTLCAVMKAGRKSMME